MTVYNWRCRLWRCQSDRSPYRNPPCSCWGCERPLMVHWWPLFAGQVWPGRSYVITNVRGVGGKQEEGFDFLHFSCILVGVFFSFLFLFCWSCLLQRLMFTRWLRKATGQEWSGGESSEKRLVHFLQHLVPCKSQKRVPATPVSPQTLSGGSGGTQSCLQPSWLSWGAWCEQGRMKMSISAGSTYSVFSFQAHTSLTWKMGKPEWVSVLGWWDCEARLIPVYRAAGCYIKVHGNSIKRLF